MKEKEEGAKPQKSGFLVRLTALAATAALLLGALTLVVYRDRFNLDALRRWFEYRELETSETGEAEPFTHAGGEQASFAYLKNGVLMASATGARYYSFSGELYAEEVRNLEHPVLSASKEAGVVYDAGVSPPRPGTLDRVAHHGAQGLLQSLGHSDRVFLHLPSVVGRSIVHQLQRDIASFHVITIPNRAHSGAGLPKKRPGHPARPGCYRDYNIV